MLKKVRLTQRPCTSPPLSETSAHLQLPPHGCPSTTSCLAARSGRWPGPHPASSTRLGEHGCHQRDAIILRAAATPTRPHLSHLLLLFLARGAGGRLSPCSPCWHRKDRQPWRNRAASHARVPQLAPESGGVFPPAPSTQGPCEHRAPAAPRPALGALPVLLLHGKGGSEEPEGSLRAPGSTRCPWVMLMHPSRRRANRSCQQRRARGLM